LISGSGIYGDVIKADIVRLIEAAIKGYEPQTRYDPAMTVVETEHGLVVVEARWQHGLVLHYRIRVSGKQV
jgi:hypothetical protein